MTSTTAPPASNHRPAVTAELPAQSSVPASVVAFWDELFAASRDGGGVCVELPDRADPVHAAALAHFGDVRGRTVLDLGCGRGAASLALARAGAHVVSVDVSQVAVDNLRRYCAAHGVDNVVPVCAPALALSSLAEQPLGPGAHRLGQVDFVFGSMILHHIEPLPTFAGQLRAILRDGGRGFFFENNARSRLLVWFRDHIVGRGWVPKFGDPEEFPLTPDEVEVLRRHFRVDVSYPWLKFFQLVPQYLLGGRAGRLFARLDRWAYAAVPALRPHSYVQYLRLS